MRIKKHEQITQANITKVIELLNPTDGSRPITKKEACGILNIAYNTTRLSNIITEFNGSKIKKKLILFIIYIYL